jgi:hypothetical protein
MTEGPFFRLLQEAQLFRTKIRPLANLKLKSL